MHVDESSMYDTDLTKELDGDKLRAYVVEAAKLGMKTSKMAKRLEPDDPVKRKALRAKLRKMARQDKRLHALIAQDANAEMALGLGPATQALARRAAKGRPDAVKLLFEASGFHNPRVKHEHSGDININLNIPRPKRLTVDPDDDAVDADVVDE